MSHHLKRRGRKIIITPKGQPPKARRKKKRGRRRRRKVGSYQSGSPSKYLRMISDPCSAKLVAGLYGDQQGILARFQSSMTLAAAVDRTCGYILWYPNYTNAHSDQTPGKQPNLNMFLFYGVNGDTVPTNTAAEPFGTCLHYNTACGVPDPAHAFVSGAVCDSARHLGSCLKMSYTGKMSDASGQISYLQNIPLDNLLREDGTAATVNQLFILSQDSRRMGVDTHSIVYQPLDPGMERFRTQNDGCIIQGDVNTSVSEHADDAKVYTPTGFGFAFRGIPAADLPNYVLEFHKNIEWKPATGQGMPIVPPAASASTSFIKSTVDKLNQIDPTWWDQASNAANYLANRVSRLALTGVANAAKQSYLKYAL